MPFYFVKCKGFSGKMLKPLHFKNKWQSPAAKLGLPFKTFLLDFFYATISLIAQFLRRVKYHGVLV